LPAVPGIFASGLRRRGLRAWWKYSVGKELSAGALLRDGPAKTVHPRLERLAADRWGSFVKVFRFSGLRGKNILGKRVIDGLIRFDLTLVAL
jgi:hypothetical protein